MNNKKDVKTYIIILLSIIFSKVLGMLRTSLLANFYGAMGIESQAFLAASKLPLMLFDITLGTAIASAFVPVLNELITKSKDKDICCMETNRFISNFTTIVGVLSALVSAICMIFPKQVILLVLDKDKNPALIEKASELLVILAPMVIFAALSFIFVGVLQSYGNFVIPAIISTVSNLAIVLYFFTLNSSFGINGLSASLFVGWLLQFLILVPWVIKIKYKYKTVVDLKDPSLIKSLKMTLPILISSWVMPLNNIVAMRIISGLSGNYSISVNEYAYQLYFVIAGVFSYALTNLYFPKLSKAFASGEKKEAALMGKNLLKSVNAIIFPVMMLFIGLSLLIVKVFYVRGSFTLDDGKITAGIMCMYALGMGAFSWQEILNKYFYSMQDSIRPMQSAIIGIVMNISLAFLLSNFMGILGIALASSISTVIMAIYLYIRAIAKSKEIFGRDVIISGSKAFASSVVAMVGSVLLNNLIGSYFSGTVMNLICLLICGAFGLIIYLGLMILLKSEEVMSLIKLKNKGGRKIG